MGKPLINRYTGKLGHEEKSNMFKYPHNGMSVFQVNLFETWSSRAIQDFDEYTIADTANVEHQ